jgi:serine/threonine protein kinase
MSGELIGGRYELRRPVGQGGMGTVWLGTDQTLHRDVAVKRMGSLPGETSAGTARAMREARSAAAMNHRNAVSVYDVVDHEDAPWLVMEYFPSRTLADIIREDGPLPPDRAGHIAAQVADALADAHKLGIMHRDVKPGNILVGDGDHSKISDFGIARAELDATLTQTGMMTGTPAYFAPELATGDDPTPASDVWALGATLFAAVEGDPPYGTKGNPLQLLSRIVQEPVPRPDHAGPLLPILGELLSKDPRSRPTMHEAATRLADPPTPTRLVQAPDRTRVAPMPPPAAPTGGAPSESTSGGGRGRRLAPLVLALLVVLALAVGGWALLRGGGGDDNTTSPEPAGQTQRADNNNQQSDNDQPDDTQPSETQPSESQPTPDDNAEPTGDPAQFVEDYYARMPDDTDVGWSMLDGSLKSQGKDNYEAFWSGIASVDVSNVTAVSPTSVVYDITYVRTDGSTSSEHKTITLDEQGGSYVIVDDQ